MTAPANLVISFKNALEHPAAVLTTTATPILPLANIQNRKRNRIFRYAASDGKVIRCTYDGSGVYASVASILRHNLEPAATWRFKAWTGVTDWSGTADIDSTDLVAIASASLGTLDWGVEPLGSGLFDPFYGQRMSRFFFTRALILCWEITINDSGNSSGNIDLSRAWVGDGFEFTYNPVYGGTKGGWQESSELWETDGGSPHVDAVIPYRRLTLDLQYMPEADRAMLMDGARFCGKGRRSVWMSLLPNNSSPELERDYEGEWLIVEMPEPGFAEYLRYSTQIVLREV